MNIEKFTRTRLSDSFYMRDFLYSEISAVHGIPNIPHFPELAIEAGSRLCQELLEPLQSAFGRLHIRSAYRSPEVNQFGNENGLKCASNKKNYARHIWDYRDAAGHLGATACVVIPWFWDRFQNQGDWQRFAWWVHDHLPYSSMVFYPTMFAVNLSWHEAPKKTIQSYASPRGILTQPGMTNHKGDHSDQYANLFRPAHKSA